MERLVYLFDIDGTLIRGKGAGSQGLRDAFDTLYGRPDACDGIRFHGATDRGIVRLALRNIAADDTEGAIDLVLATYLEHLPRWIAAGGYVAHDGVTEILAALSGRDGVAVGLGTGNIEAAARLKLDPPRLNDHFRFGGYGSDAEDRGELLAIGAQRGAASLGVARHACRVLVIGDTTRDVAAALAIGASCLGVTTGDTSAEDLRAAGAAVVVESLADPAAARFLGTAKGA